MREHDSKRTQSRSGKPSDEDKAATGEALAWASRVGELANWTQATLVIRTDRYGRYTPTGMLTEPAEAGGLTRERLIRH